MEMLKTMKKIIKVKMKAKISIKTKIPRALREQVWLKICGKKFESKCTIRWCENIISVFDFHAGHNIPESKGGPTTLENLKPICSRCNLSMGNDYSIDEWDNFGSVSEDVCCGYLGLFRFFKK